MSFMIVFKWLSEKESDPFALVGEGQPPFRIVRMIFRAAAIMLVVAAMGCGAAPVNDDVADDEAMKRAIVEGKPAAQAAKEYFYPTKIVDYFDGMDPQKEHSAHKRYYSFAGDIIWRRNLRHLQEAIRRECCKRLHTSFTHCGGEFLAD